MSSVSSLAPVPYQGLVKEVNSVTALPPDIAAFAASFLPPSDFGGYDVADEYWSGRVGDLKMSSPAVQDLVGSLAGVGFNGQKMGAFLRKSHQDCTAQIELWRSILIRNDDLRGILEKPLCDLSEKEIRKLSSTIFFLRNDFLIRFFQDWSIWAAREKSEDPTDLAIVTKMREIQYLEQQDKAADLRKWVEDSNSILHKATRLPFLENLTLGAPSEIIDLKGLNNETFSHLFCKVMTGADLYPEAAEKIIHSEKFKRIPLILPGEGHDLTQTFNVACLVGSQKGVECMLKSSRSQELSLPRLLNSYCVVGSLKAVQTLLTSSKRNELLNKEVMNQAYWRAVENGKRDVVEYLEQDPVCKKFIQTEAHWEMRRIAAKVVLVASLVMEFVFAVLMLKTTIRTGTLWTNRVHAPIAAKYYALASLLSGLIVISMSLLKDPLNRRLIE